jgi:hypothetical protein
MNQRKDAPADPPFHKEYEKNIKCCCKLFSSKHKVHFGDGEEEGFSKYDETNPQTHHI